MEPTTNQGDGAREQPSPPAADHVLYVPPYRGPQTPKPQLIPLTEAVLMGLRITRRPNGQLVAQGPFQGKPALQTVRPGVP